MKKYLLLGLFILGFAFVPSFSFAELADIDPGSSTLDCISIVNNLRYKDKDVNKNDEVSVLQDFLQGQGYLNGEPTGYFGLLTFKAVKDFQKANGITPTGYVGSITKAKIKTLACDNSTIPNNTDVSYSSGCTSTSIYSSTTGLRCDVGQQSNCPLISQPAPGFCPEGTIEAVKDSNNCITSYKCNINTTPSITVLSPNGGETYTAGQKIEVKWISNTNLSNSQVMVSLKSTQLAYSTEITVVPNTGLAIITLPTSLVPGKYYKILLQLDGNAISYRAPTDTSDSLFTINSATTTTDGCIPGSLYSSTTGLRCDVGQQSNCPLISQPAPGFCPEGTIEAVKDSNNCITSYKCNINTTPSITVLSPNGGETYTATVLSPNGGGTYTAGQEITVKWKSANISNTEKVIIVLDALPNSGVDGYNISLSNGTPNDGLETYILNSQIKGKFKIRIQKLDNSYINDSSDDYFTINSTGVTPLQCSITVSIASSTPPARTLNKGELSVPLTKFNLVPNCDARLKSFAVSILPATDGYKNLSSLRLYKENGAQIGNITNVNKAGLNFENLDIPINSGQTLVLETRGDISLSAVSGATLYAIFGGSWAVDSSGAGVGNNASGNIIAGNVMTINGAVNANPNITILSPNGGENYAPWEEIEIRWKSENLPSNPRMNIMIVDGNGNVVSENTDVLVGTSQSITYPLGNIPIGRYKVWINFKDNTAEDYSDNFFNVLELNANALGAFNSATSHPQQNPQVSFVNNTGDLFCGDENTILMKGMVRQEVKCLQNMLIKAGFKIKGVELGQETELFGYKTFEALKTFQVENQIKADGVFGPESYRVLTTLIKQ